MNYRIEYAPVTPDDRKELVEVGPYQNWDVVSGLNGSDFGIKIYKGSELRALASWHVDFREGRVKSSPLSYAQGLVYAAKHLDRPVSKALSEPLQLVETIGFWCNQNGLHRLDIDLHYSELDTRPWVWGLETTGFAVEVRPRYSAVIDLRNKTKKELLMAMRAVRRQELRSFEVAGLVESVFIQSAGPLEVAEAWKQVVDPEGIDDEELLGEYLAIKERLHLTPNSSYRKFDLESSNQSHYSVLLTGGKETHLVANFQMGDNRVRGFSTFSTVEAILSALSAGADIFDFNGANSPLRGDDKHSYGAKPKLFFNISASLR